MARNGTAGYGSNPTHIRAHGARRRRAREYPTPAFVEVHTSDDGSCLLLHFDASGRCQGDTWHETLEDAKDQANYEFRIVSDDWMPV